MLAVPAMHGGVPLRRAGGATRRPRAGPVCMLKILGMFWCAAAALWAAAPTCQSVGGWQQQGKPREHTAENLFEYMDGNAEGYLIYGFAGMQGVNCKNAAGDTLILDISEFL